jgi:hypothetical protein
MESTSYFTTQRLTMTFMPAALEEIKAAGRDTMQQLYSQPTGAVLPAVRQLLLLSSAGVGLLFKFAQSAGPDHLPDGMYACMGLLSHCVTWVLGASPANKSAVEMFKAKIGPEVRVRSAHWA